MIDTEILERAIRKAIDGGWQPKLDKGTTKDQERYVLKHSERLEHIIYNHDFAKALWGEDYAVGDRLVDGNVAWKFHLMHMVIAPDPIKYLGENI